MLGSLESLRLWDSRDGVGPFRGCSLRRPAPPGWVQAPSRAWKKEGQALGVLELSPGFVSRRPQQAPLGHRWHCCLDLRTPKARRRHGCSRPPPLGPARGLAVCLGIRPLEGAGRIDHASPSFPALPPQTHQPFSTLRLRQAATGQSGGGRDAGAASGAGGKGGTLSVSGGGGRGGGWAREERASDLASSEHREAPPAPAAGQARAPRRGLRDLARPRDCPPGATIQEPSALLWLLPAALPPHCLAPGRPARARQGLALPSGHRAGTQEPGLRSRVQPGAEPGTEWRAPPTPARGHPQPGWGGSDPPRLLLGSTSDASQHGPPPSLIRKSQVSARPLQPPKESPQTRGKGPETPGRGLCPGQARGPGGDREASELPRPSRAPSPAPLGVALYLGLRPRGSGAGPAESRSVVSTWQPAFSSGDWSSEQFYNPGEVRYPVATSREAVYAAPARSGIRRGGEMLATPTLPPLL